MANEVAEKDQLALRKASDQKLVAAQSWPVLKNIQAEAMNTVDKLTVLFA